MKYKIYEKETEKIYEFEIEDVITHIKNNKNNTFYKYIDNEIIKINNTYVTDIHFICHRINTIDELSLINSQFGIEVDIRDDHRTGELILAHDPFVDGCNFNEYMKNYYHNTLILNIKSERTELQCLDIMKQYNNTNYFFLDSSFPMIYLLYTQYNNNKIACRFSEFEPIEQFLKIVDMITYVWIDCFTYLPLTNEIYNLIKEKNKKICIVSPELQKKTVKDIIDYRHYLIDKNIIPDIICCKVSNIIYWI